MRLDRTKAKRGKFLIEKQPAGQPFRADPVRAMAIEIARAGNRRKKSGLAAIDVSAFKGRA